LSQYITYDQINIALSSIRKSYSLNLAYEGVRDHPNMPFTKHQ